MYTTKKEDASHSPVCNLRATCMAIFRQQLWARKIDWCQGR